jgi:hypothetical protein
MQTITSLALSGLVVGSLFLGHSARAADSGEGKWESLFNGKDLSGWVAVHDVTFEVKDGHLRLVKGMGWLRTAQPFSDFILEFECRALEEKYDSGIFFRCGLEGKPWPKDGWQMNLRYDMLGGVVKGNRPMVPSETSKKPVDQWVKFRFEANGKKATLDIDGERSWETDVLEPGSGYLGIQAEDKSFDFRNLRVQRLGR